MIFWQTFIKWLLSEVRKCIQIIHWGFVEDPPPHFSQCTPAHKHTHKHNKPGHIQLRAVVIRAYELDLDIGSENADKLSPNPLALCTFGTLPPDNRNQSESQKK